MLRERISALDENRWPLLAERRELALKWQDQARLSSSGATKSASAIYWMRLIRRRQAHHLDGFYVTRLFQLIIEDSF
ncbi:hypothetical protein M8494_22475 [Serratia ureilytica]